MTGKVLTLTGTDGSGKSSATEQLCNAIPNTIRVSIWDTLALDNQLFSDRAKAGRYLAKLQNEARALFLFHSLSQSYAMAMEKKPPLLIWDGGPYKYAASEMAMGTSPELIMNLLKIFKAPDLTFFLEVTPEEAWLRKDQTSGYERYFAKEDSPQAFISFQQAIQRQFLILERNFGPWVHIPQGNLKEITQTLTTEVSRNAGL